MVDQKWRVKHFYRSVVHDVCGLVMTSRDVSGLRASLTCDDDGMQAGSVRKRGLYASYNEEKNGSFDEAIEISRTRGCIVWLDKSPIRSNGLEFPLDFFVRLTGHERYFRGSLLAVLRAEDTAADFVAGEMNHRPEAWRLANPAPMPGIDFKSVLYISHLSEVAKPDELGSLGPPQHPTYVLW